MQIIGNSGSSLPLKCACDPLQDRCDGKTVDFCLSNSTCFSAVVKKAHKVTVTMGCLEGIEHSHMTCRVGSKESVAILCCNSHDYCNRHLSPQINPNNQTPQDVHPSSEFGSHFHETIYALIGFTLLTLVGVFLFWFVHSRGKLKSLNTWMVKRSSPTTCHPAACHPATCYPSTCHSPTSQSAGELKIIEIGDSTLKGLLENSCTSGSGSGAPLLAQRTISWSIELVEMIGRGRYGQVWRGVYQDEPVAVKIFSSHAEAAWRRECNIYKTVLIRHENILTFIAADTLSRLHSCTQLWLITRYHEHGSLYDYLNNHPLSREEMLEMLLSAASGLVHLHTTIIGSQGKPGIAHRDIKSKNILVMSNKRCCIADLGLAVIETRFETFRLNSSMWNHCNNNNNSNNSNNNNSNNSNNNSNNNNNNSNNLSASQTNEPINLKVGTKRYMSPEVLDDSLDLNNFEAFKKSDVYSFALVMWETCKRCLVEDKCDDYELPYYSMVPCDPSYEEMNFVVCRSKARPLPAQRWSNDRVLMGLFRLMEECWSPSPEVRHSMLRLKKSIAKLSLLDKCNNNSNKKQSE